MMTESSLFAAFLNAQPAPIRDWLQFQFCMRLVKEEEMNLLSIVPGDAGPVCLFQDSTTGGFISVMIMATISEN
jgi:hypothetical protein